MSVEAQKSFIVRLLEQPDLLTQEPRDEDILSAVDAIEQVEPAWLLQTFGDERFPLPNRKVVAGWLIGPSAKEIRGKLGLPL